MADGEFERIIATNLTGVFNVAKAAGGAMKAAGRGGVIVNVASILGLRVASHLSAYAASKAAVVQLTKSLALEWARYGIRVNALCPGWVDTPFNAPFIAKMGGREAIESYIKEKVPMGRWADVEEIAEPILFLVSDRSSYMTGQILVVDGGETVV